MPKASETAMGTRNCAWIERSKISGRSPANVVTEVSRMGRNLLLPASITVS